MFSTRARSLALAALFAATSLPSHAGTAAQPNAGGADSLLQHVAELSVRQYMLADSQSTAQLARYHKRPETQAMEELDEIQSIILQRQELRRVDFRRKLDAPSIEALRREFIERLDVVRRNGRCGADLLPALSEASSSTLRQDMAVYCEFADIVLSPDALHPGLSRRERMEMQISAAEAAGKAQPTRRMNGTVTMEWDRRSGLWRADHVSMYELTRRVMRRMFTDKEEVALQLTRFSYHPDDMGGVAAQDMAQLVLDGAVHRDQERFRELTRYRAAELEDRPLAQSITWEAMPDLQRRRLDAVAETLPWNGYGPEELLRTLAPLALAARCTASTEQQVALSSYGEPTVTVAAVCVVRLPAELGSDALTRLRALTPEQRMQALITIYEQAETQGTSVTVPTTLLLMPKQGRWTLLEPVETHTARLMLTLAEHAKRDVESLFGQYTPCGDDCDVPVKPPEKWRIEPAFSNGTSWFDSYPLIPPKSALRCLGAGPGR